MKIDLIDAVMPDRHREKFRTYFGKTEQKLGKCLICEERVRKSHRYLTVSEGYAHKGCLKEWRSGD